MFSRNHDVKVKWSNRTKKFIPLSPNRASAFCKLWLLQSHANLLWLWSRPYFEKCIYLLTMLCLHVYVSNLSLDMEHCYIASINIIQHHPTLAWISLVSCVPSLREKHAQGVWKQSPSGSLPHDSASFATENKLLMWDKQKHWVLHGYPIEWSLIVVLSEWWLLTIDFWFALQTAELWWPPPNEDVHCCSRLPQGPSPLQ